MRVYAVFTKLLNMSIAAGILALAIIVLRFCLQKAPKKYICILWALVALRLVCLIGISSSLSVLTCGYVYLAVWCCVDDGLRSD